MIKIGVYILQCGNGRYYIGSTDNVERRISEHQRGIVKATQNVLPISLAFFQPCNTLMMARKLEYWLKSKKSRVIVEKIIAEGYIRAARLVG